MTTEQHKTGPYWTQSGRFNTGNMPMANDAKALHDHARWLLNFAKRGPIFWFIGPGPFEPNLVPDHSPYRHINPDYDYDGTPYLAVITRIPYQSGIVHAMGGELLAWRYGTGSTITWRYPNPAGGWYSKEMFHAYSESHSDMDTVHFTQKPEYRIALFKDMYTYGSSTSEFSYCKLEYIYMMVGGLMLWGMPDYKTEMAKPGISLFQEHEFQTGHLVRGYDASRKCLGTLIGNAGNIIERTGRCLLQSGHPLGVYTTNSSTYVDLRNGRTTHRSSFMASPKALYRGNYLSASTAIVAFAKNASAENPGYVKFTSNESGDTSIFEITADTEALYSDPSSLTLYRNKPTIEIDLKAPTGGAVGLRSYSIWED